MMRKWMKELQRKSQSIKDAMKQDYPGMKELRLTKPVAKLIIMWQLVLWLLVCGIFLGMAYNPFLVTLDIGLILFFGLHKLLLRPMMMTGQVRGYYRTTYYTKFIRIMGMIKHFVVFGAAVRLILLLSMLSILNFGTIGGFTSDWLARTANINGYLVALAIYGMYLYLMHYQERKVKVSAFIASLALEIRQRVHPERAAQIVQAELLRKNRPQPTQPAPAPARQRKKENNVSAPVVHPVAEPLVPSEQVVISYGRPEPEPTDTTIPVFEQEAPIRRRVKKDQIE